MTDDEASLFTNPAPADDARLGYAFVPVPRSMIDDGRLGSMDGATIRVYLVLLSFRQHDSGHERFGLAWPGVGTIARKACVHPGTVGRRLAALQDLQLIKKVDGRTRDGTAVWSFGSDTPAELRRRNSAIAPAQPDPPICAGANGGVAPAQGEVAPAQEVSCAGARIDRLTPDQELLNEKSAAAPRARAEPAAAVKVRKPRPRRPAPARPAEVGGRAPESSPDVEPTLKLRMTPAQSGVWRTFNAWYTGEAFPRTHAGAAYGFSKGRDAKAAHAILGNPNVRWDFDAAKRIASAFAVDPDRYIARRGHKLYDLADRVDVYAAQLAGHNPQPNGAQYAKPNGFQDGNAHARPKEKPDHRGAPPVPGLGRPAAAGG